MGKDANFKTQRLLNEQTRMLYEGARGASLASLFNGAILVVVLWPVVDHVRLIAWLLALACMSFARLIVWGFYVKAKPLPGQASLWARRYILGGYVAALLWGSAVVWLFPSESIGHQVFVAFVIAGMCAGAVTRLSFLKPPVISYLTLTLIPLSIQFVLIGSTLSLAMSVMVFLFLGMTLASALLIYKNTALNIEMRFKAADSEKALRESEERYRTIFESAPLGVVHYDVNGIVLSCNGMFSDQLGRIGEVCAGVSLFQTLADDKARAALQKSLSGEVGVYTGDMCLDDPTTPLYVRIYFRGITSVEGKITGGVAMIEDLTDDKRVERLKSELVSVVSHELITPLTAIRGSLGVMNAEEIQGKPELTAELLDNATRNTSRLLALVNDILDIDKIEQGKLEYNIELLSVMPFIDKVVEQIQPYAEQRAVKINVTKRVDDINIEADEQRMMQVMSNLLSNAVKFSPEGEAVEIAVSEIIDRPDVCISVLDSGAGIPKEFQDKMFDSFTQYDSSDIRKVGGTGLGLSIAKAIVEHHRGLLVFENRPGKGTRFDVILPRA